MVVSVQETTEHLASQQISSIPAGDEERHRTVLRNLFKVLDQGSGSGQVSGDGLVEEVKGQTLMRRTVWPPAVVCWLGPGVKEEGHNTATECSYLHGAEPTTHCAFDHLASDFFFHLWKKESC